MIHVSGTSDTPNALGYRVALGVHHRPVAATLVEELFDALAGVAEDDRVELGAVGTERTLLIDELDQLGVLLDARHAVGLEEVQHDPTALAPGEIERCSVVEFADRLRARAG